MKLLWFTENYYPSRGGMAQSCDRIVFNLRQKGIEIDVVHFTNRGKAFVTEIQQNGSYTACSIDEDISHSLNLLSNFLLAKKSIYDFILAFGGYLPIFSAPIFSKWLGIKLITMIRGNDFDSALFTPKRRDILFYALEKSELIFTVDSAKKWKIEKLFPSIRTEFIANGINLSDWKLSKSDLKNAKKWKEKNVQKQARIIGLFGHLKQKKGIDFFIEALCLSMISSKIHLLIVGDLPTETQELLAISQISYSQYDFMDKYELLSYYPVCHAVALPSFYDGMPNVLLEAGGLAIPFIAADIHGISDVLSAGEHGFLFEVGNLNACAHALFDFVNTEENILQEMGNKMKKHIEENFSDTLETQKYFSLLSELMK